MRASNLVGVVLLLAALGTGVAAREHARLREGLDLKPRPDALEYGLAARSLAQHGTYAIDVAGVDYAPRYPIGFPLLAAPFVALAGGDPSAVSTAAYAFGVLLIALLAALGWLAAGPLGAAVCAVMGALSPALVRASTLAMSETASACCITAAITCAILSNHRLGRSRVRTFAGLAGCALAAAASIRVTALILVLPLLAALWCSSTCDLRSRARVLVVFLAPIALAGAAILAFNAHRFGAANFDGYRFWVPELYGNRDLLFSTRYAVQPVPGYWDRSHLAVYGDALLGHDAWLWTKSALLLALLGIARCLTVEGRCPAARTVMWTTALFVPALIVFQLVYAWQDRRFLVPLIPVIAVLAACGAEYVRRGIEHGSKRLAIAAFALPVMLAFDLHSRAEPAQPAGAPPALVTTLQDVDAFLPAGSIAVINFPASLLHAYLPGREAWLQDRASADPHVERIAFQGQRGLDGSLPAIRSLVVGGTVDAKALADLVARATATPAYFVSAVGEGDSTTAREAILRVAELERVESRPPLTIERIVPRK